MKNKKNKNCIVIFLVLILCVINLILILSVKKSIPTIYSAGHVHFTYVPAETKGEEAKAQVSFYLYSSDRNETSLSIPENAVFFECILNNGKSYYIETIGYVDEYNGDFSVNGGVNMYEEHDSARAEYYKNTVRCEFAGVRTNK